MLYLQFDLTYIQEHCVLCMKLQFMAEKKYCSQYKFNAHLKYNHFIRSLGETTVIG